MIEISGEVQNMAEDRNMLRMKELVRILNEASKAYYAENREIMSNFEFDALYDELENLEKETGTVLSSSPTQRVGYEAVNELPKETHEKPMLSLAKTKDREALRAFIGQHKTLVSWKLDGLTVVLTYENGALAKAVTRGNGLVGDVITANARTFLNIPLKIPFQGQLILRGEAVITYPDFEKINESLGENAALYKNPRNLCSGSVRQLNSEITAQRRVRFYAFALVKADGADFENSRMKQFEFLNTQGFETVEYKAATADNLDEVFAYFEQKVKNYEIPSDGLVALYDDIAYGDSLGNTQKSPRNAMAFKWQDEQALTHLTMIEWSPSRTGLINPVAVFEPVELEGTTVTRASVHNVSILRSLKLGIGDEISVYKANMIIPQIAENLTKSDTVEIPDVCPVCGCPTAIHTSEGAQTLFCENPDCAAKKIRSFAQFVSRDAMNIDGMSEMTLEKFIAKGFIHTYADIFRLGRWHDEIVAMDGFGEKSAVNLEASIDRARHMTLPRVLFALGIPNIGVANAKVISRYFNGEISRARSASSEELAMIEGVGPIMAGAFAEWFADPKNAAQVDDLLGEITIEGAGAAGRVRASERAGASEASGDLREDDSGDGTQDNLGASDGGIVRESKAAGKTFVVTGSVTHFKNRRELQEKIEEEGGKVTGSVSKKTDYLINNDVSSGSNKNVTAKKLGVPIITEEQFLELLNS